MASNRRAFINAMRPDLAEMEGRHVDVRATIGFCDANGTPRCKDRFFLVTSRVAREVMVAGKPQRRANLHPAFARLNGTPDALIGLRTLRMTLESVSVEDAYREQCVCRKAPTTCKPSPPGNQAYCRTTDAITAYRWNPQTMRQEPIPCLGSECPLRQEYIDDKNRRFRPAKTELTIVGKLDIDDHPRLLCSTTTGSDTNDVEWHSLLDSIEAKWLAMSLLAGRSVPFHPYGLPIELTPYTATSQTGAYPRINYTLGCDLEEAFATAIARQRTLPALFSGARAPLLITGEIEQLDADEVTFVGQDFDADTGEPAQPITQQATNQPPPPPVIPPVPAPQAPRKPWYVQAADDLAASLAEGADVSDIMAYLEKQHSDSRKASYAIQAITPHADKLLAAGHADALIRMGIIQPVPVQASPVQQQTPASVPDAEIEDDNGFPPAPVKPPPAEGSPEWFATLTPDAQAKNLIDLLATFTKPDELPEYHRSLAPLSAVCPDFVKKREDVRAAFKNAWDAMGYNPKAK